MEFLMFRAIRRTTRRAVWCSFLTLSAIAFGFQHDGPLVSAVPRTNLVPTPTRENRPIADLRVDVPLVEIPVHVTTPLGASVTNLKKENFRVFEDGVEQEITHFTMDDAPLSIGLVFDSSGSMAHKIRKSSEAAAAFFKTANFDDEFFLVEFNEKPKLEVPFTRNSDEIYKHIVRAKAMGRTSLLDAIRLSLVQMKNAQHLRKAVVIFSDGGDNRSRYTETEVMEAMREADVQVYAMGIFDLDSSRKATPEERNGPRLLDSLAEETGGRHFPVQNLEDLPAVCARIGNELRNQYLLGYAPTNAGQDGKYRRVKVVLKDPENTPPLHAYHRQGYYAPSQ
jgi:Ca-activated chloride channel homolog